MKKNSALLLFTLFVFFGNSFAKNTIGKDSDQQLIKTFSYFRSNNEVSIREIIGHDHWKENTANHEKSLITETGYLHIRFVLHNHSSEEDFLLAVSRLEDVVYHDLNSTIKIKQIGQDTPMSQRKVNSGFKNYAKIKLKPHSLDTLYASINMNANSINAQTFDFEISNQQKFTETTTVRLITQAVLIGALLIMCFFNLFIFFVVRDKNHLLYVITTFLIACIWVSSAGEGYFLQYLYPETPTFAKFDNLLLTPLYAIFLILFIQSYLKTKLHTPKWHYFLSVLAFLQLLLTLVRLSFVLPFEIEEFISLAIGMVIFTSIFCVTLFHLYQKIPQSKYFLYGNFIFYPLAMSYMVYSFDAISSSDFAWYAMEVGNVVEMIFFSLALGDTINTLKKDQTLLTENLRLTEINLNALKKESESFYFPQSAIQINFEDIIFLESSDHYVLVHIKERKNPLLERTSMSKLMKAFPETNFVKIHRSFYINIHQIATRPSKYLLTMSNDIEVTISRSYVDNLGNKFL